MLSMDYSKFQVYYKSYSNSLNSVSDRNFAQILATTHNPENVGFIVSLSAHFDVTTRCHSFAKFSFHLATITSIYSYWHSSRLGVRESRQGHADGIEYRCAELFSNILLFPIYVPELRTYCNVHILEPVASLRRQW